MIFFVKKVLKKGQNLVVFTASFLLIDSVSNLEYRISVARNWRDFETNKVNFYLTSRAGDSYLLLWILHILLLFIWIIHLATSNGGVSGTGSKVKLPYIMMDRWTNNKQGVKNE